MDALNIAVDHGSTHVPKVLVDNGSSINVCPLSTLTELGISIVDLAPCTQTIRAYDNTGRAVLGTVSLPLSFGVVEMKVEFHVIDIKTTFNLLLGRPWIHGVKGVLSTLHQMIRFPHNGCIITIMAEKCIGKAKERDTPC